MDRVAQAIDLAQAMTPAELDKLLDHLAGSARVEAAGWRVRERRLSVERFPARNAAVRAARKKGLSYSQISKLFGLQRGAVIQIIRRGNEVCMRNECTHLNDVTVN